MGSNLLSSLFGVGQASTNIDQQLNQNIQQASMLQQQQNALAAQYQQQQANNVGSILKQQYAYTIPEDQLDRMKEDYLLSRRERFLKCPVAHREAFLQTLRARAVQDAMDDSGFFGVNRSNSQWATMSNGLAMWQPPEITLEMYESWHADAEMEKILSESPEECPNGTS
jgi:hypothetical protein